MKFEATQKLSRFLLSLLCFVALLFVFVAALASSFNTGLEHALFG